MSNKLKVSKKKYHPEYSLKDQAAGRCPYCLASADMDCDCETKKVSKCSKHQVVHKNGGYKSCPTPKKERNCCDKCTWIHEKDQCRNKNCPCHTPKSKERDYLLRIQGWAVAFEKDNSSVDIRWLTTILKEILTT